MGETVYECCWNSAGREFICSWKPYWLFSWACQGDEFALTKKWGREGSLSRSSVGAGDRSAWLHREFTLDRSKDKDLEYYYKEFAFHCS